MQASIERAARHERFLDYTAIAIQVLSLIFALTAVVLLMLTAKYYADHNAASQGVKIFGFGASSIVAASHGVNAAPIAGRLRSRKRRNKAN